MKLHGNLEILQLGSLCFFNAAALLSISGGENFEIYGLINMPTHPSEGSRLANYYQNDKHRSRDCEHLICISVIHFDFPFIYLF